MTNFHLGLIAAAAALSYGAPLLAAPEPTAKQEIVKEVVINHDGHGDASDGQRVEIRKVIKDGDGRSIEGRHGNHGEFVAKCSGRKFESAAETGTAKDKNVRKMVLCSKEGTSDAEWSKTLKDALARLQADDRLPSEGKAKIVADLNAEIAKYNR